MRDWDRNGKTDGRDYYLFHEEILKDHSESENEPAHTCTGSSYRRTSNTTNSSDSNKKEQKEIGCLPILLLNIVLIILLEILESL